MHAHMPPVTASQIMTVLSSLQLARSLPSGLKETELTQSVWISLRLTGFQARSLPVAVFTPDLPWGAFEDVMQC